MELTWLSLVGIALGLAMDAFAVSIAVGMGLKAITPRHVFRLGFHFGLFQFMMPIVGWLAGRQLVNWISNYDHWAAFALLSYVGGKMIWDAWHKKPAEDRGDPTRGLMLVTLSVATSLDALAVGMSMALVGVSIWLPSAVIGLVAAAMTAIGMTLSNRLGRWGHWAELAGGIVLLLIGLEILIMHVRS
jgi:manganese efflux pump family protein